MPAASVALAVIVWVPRPKMSPDWTTLLPSLKTTGSVPSTRSVAVAANVATAPFDPVASSVWLATAVSVGGVVSLTVMVKLSDAALPAASVAGGDRVGAEANVSPE